MTRQSCGGAQKDQRGCHWNIIRCHFICQGRLLMARWMRRGLSKQRAETNHGCSSTRELAYVCFRIHAVVYRPKEWKRVKFSQTSAAARTRVRDPGMLRLSKGKFGMKFSYLINQNRGEDRGELRRTSSMVAMIKVTYRSDDLFLREMSGRHRLQPRLVRDVQPASGRGARRDFQIIF